MQGRALQRHAAECADELPGSELTHPFGEDWDVYKVRGKVFMLQAGINGDPMVTLKADPAEAEALASAHSEITPGYHMNKKHWITLHPGGLDAGLVADLVTESYLLVVAGLPRAQRPVDPATFGRAAGGRAAEG